MRLSSNAGSISNSLNAEKIAQPVPKAVNTKRITQIFGNTESNKTVTARGVKQYPRKAIVGNNGRR